MAPGLGLGNSVTADLASTLLGGIPAATKDFNFAQDQKSDSNLNSQDNIVFGRGSVGRAMNSSGNIVEVSSGEPRYEYDKDGNSLGLLMEEESTQNLMNSDFGSSWNAYESGGLLSGTTTTGPDGVSGSGKGIGTIAGSKYNVTYDFGQFTTGFGATDGSDTHEQDCFSVYAKKGNVDYLRFAILFLGSTQVGASFNLNTGAVDNSTNVTASIVDVGNGWYRCIISNVSMPARSGGDGSAYGGVWFSPSGSSSSNYSEQRDEGADKYVYLWNAQRDDDQQYAGSPIVSSGGTATRATDTCTITPSNLGYTANGTFLVELKRLYAAATTDDSGADDHASYLVMTPSSGLNDLVLACTDTKEKLTASYGGSANASIEIGDDVAANTAFKIAVGLAEDDFGGSLNGATTVVDSDADIADDAFATVHIGGQVGISGGTNVNGHIKRLRFWDSRLPNNQLEELSS